VRVPDLAWLAMNRGDGFAVGLYVIVKRLTRCKVSNVLVDMGKSPPWKFPGYDASVGFWRYAEDLDEV
jgi:hypothetical protein